MSDQATIEIIYQPAPSIEISMLNAAQVVIEEAPAVTLELALAISGPKGDPGPPGESINLSQTIGNPETDYALLYEIAKL